MKSFHHPLPSSSGFLGRASLIAHARPAKNRNIGLAAEQRRSWIQDDEVLHSHFHMPSLYLLPTVTQHEGVCLRNSPSVSWALGPFTIPVLCYAVLVILASCHKNVTIALFSSLLCHALRNEHQRPPSLGRILQFRFTPFSRVISVRLKCTHKATLHQPDSHTRNRRRLSAK